MNEPLDEALDEPLDPFDELYFFLLGLLAGQEQLQGIVRDEAARIRPRRQPARSGGEDVMSGKTLDALRDEAEARGITWWDDEWTRRDFIEAFAFAAAKTPTPKKETKPRVPGLPSSFPVGSVSGSPHGAHAYNVEPLDDE